MQNHRQRQNGSQTTAPKGEPNEGEGSRSAARRYDTAAEQAAKNTAHVEAAAKKAERALEGKEGESLRRAEEQGKRAEHKPQKS